ncbi:MAG: hypothetical protein E5Y79_16110 [Mesorhizobium sp.]|uniref:hypothetical protein n=1 Tax=Mesorhizobium sp. TaxID=1871066 RepID=UPI001201DB43|nr:hypothetical protein [Mesorhizobium sp.]TIL59259.1 MAG: hypothetical protein E5Y79_16110 [Mesorhizobium sp.]TIL83941.1 MAG: hypothetical protein E5Y73_35485 [Mesorhizobium sp.]
MGFPVSNLGPFEGDNEKWCKHAAAEFTRTVTSVGLEAADWDDAHLAVAHLLGFVICAMADAGRRGEGQQIMPDLLEKVRPMIDGLMAGTIVVHFPNEIGPHLTVLSGGKRDPA